MVLLLLPPRSRTGMTVPWLFISMKYLGKFWHLWMWMHVHPLYTYVAHRMITGRDEQSHFIPCHPETGLILSMIELNEILLVCWGWIWNLCSDFVEFDCRVALSPLTVYLFYLFQMAQDLALFVLDLLLNAWLRQLMQLLLHRWKGVLWTFDLWFCRCGFRCARAISMTFCHPRRIGSHHWSPGMHIRRSDLSVSSLNSPSYSRVDGQPNFSSTNWISHQ